MTLPINPPFPPMEAELVDEIPEGKKWQYEPKWDGFRCLVFRDGEQVKLQSKSGQPLERYFPEILDAFRQLKASKFIIDGEIAIPIEGKFSFDDLLQRIHPAQSRVLKLARETPAVFIAFDLLMEADGTLLTGQPLRLRRKRLERFARAQFQRGGSIRLSPVTTDASVAKRWFSRVGPDLDGIVAKQIDFPYASGKRAMQKVKRARTADCVVGGFRYAEKAKVVGSLLLGLYNDAGQLDHVGFCSGLTAAERKRLVVQLEDLIEPPGFTGRAPGGLSRWSTKRSMEWEPLRTQLVVEVSYDHFTGGRFRHGTRLLRWRPDKAPSQCRMDQIETTGAGSLALLAA